LKENVFPNNENRGLLANVGNSELFAGRKEISFYCFLHCSWFPAYQGRLQNSTNQILL